MSSPCARCYENCCSRYLIVVNCFDIFRISKKTGLSFENFCDLSPLSEGLLNYVPFSFALGSQEKFVLHFTRVNDSCPFCSPIDKPLRCQIYEVRPGVCKSYPFSFESGKISKVSDCICPEEWILTPQEEKDFADAYLRYNVEFAEYKEILDIWHSHQRHKLIQINAFSNNFRKDFALFLNFLTDYFTHYSRPNLHYID